MRMFRSVGAVLTASAIGAALMAAGVPAAAARTAHPVTPLTSTWQNSLANYDSNSPSVTAITASTPTSAFAFENETGQATTIYQLTESPGNWGFQSHLGSASNNVTSATSDAAANGNFWAFTSKRQTWWWSGSIWLKIKNHFTKSIGSGLAVGTDHVWVFGEPYVPGANLGAWYYNGSSWKNYRSGKGLYGASALSASNIWGYAAKSVEHFNGSTWKSTSIAGLLPKKTELCGFPHLTGIAALSSRNVYAVGSGGCQDVGGPFVLLHYNGHSWRRLVLDHGLGAPQAVVPDGSGGVWIPVMTAEFGSMEHYSGGHLHTATMPFSKKHLALFGASTAPGTTATFAAGYYRASFTASTSTGEVFEYEP
jgi:hypothetical protein